MFDSDLFPLAGIALTISQLHPTMFAAYFWHQTAHHHRANMHERCLVGL